MKMEAASVVDVCASLANTVQYDVMSEQSFVRLKVTRIVSKLLNRSG